jgi:apolipoprotein D and lipocalin family protein
MRKILPTMLIMIFILSACASPKYSKTVPHVDLDRFMKKWFVIAGRLTSFEEGAHNAVEEYKYNQKEQRIDISFSFNKDSFDGKLKEIPQKAWPENKETNAHWKISPFWPLKFDYLIIALADDYSWTAIGVPNQKYLWIMADDWNMSEAKLQEVINQIRKAGYPVNDIIRVPQKWTKAN